MKSFSFSTRGSSSKDYGIECISSNILAMSKLSYDKHTVRGADAPVLLFNDFRDRIVLSIEVVIKSTTNIYDSMDRISQWLMYDTSDLPIRFSNMRDKYYVGFFENFENIKEYNDCIAICTMKFNCKPLKYLDSGDNGEFGYFAPGQVSHIRAMRKCMRSRPRIEFTIPNGLQTLQIHISSGTGDYRKQSMIFEGLQAIPAEKTLIIDGERMECYYIDERKQVIPCNHLMKGDFPEVFDGEYKISGSGSNLSTPIPFKIYSRWRVL